MGGESSPLGTWGAVLIEHLGKGPFTPNIVIFWTKNLGTFFPTRYKRARNELVIWHKSGGERIQLE
jgi:hypothetical protein